MSQEIFWIDKKGNAKKTVYEGKKNKTEFEFFVNICKTDKDVLKTYLYQKLQKYYLAESIIEADGFVYAKGTCPILLTAHMDTVHKETVKDFYELKYYNKERKRTEHKISSPQGIGGDDRCGIYMILTILKETEFRPSILFCEDEEIGSVGSDKFLKHKDLVKEISELKYFIELDRANAYDAVYYDCGNRLFQGYVEEFGFEEHWGSFSDISNLSPKTDVASVNLSCGYYEAHTIEEYVIVEEMYDTIRKVTEMLGDVDNIEAFDYQEVSYYKSSWYDEYIFGTKTPDYSGIEITFVENGKEDYAVYECEKESDLPAVLGNFFIEHPAVCWNDVTDYYMY